MKVLSLFTGIGAFEKALKNIGIDYELIGFSEIDKYAIKSYCAIHNVSEDKNLGDITKIDITKLPKDIDLITHGSPCFLAGEQVNTINGFKNIEDIKIGDYVKSHDGTYNKVIETMKNQNNYIYDIKCGATHLINTTFNHPFYVLRNGKKQWVEARDLTTNDFMLIPINKHQNEIEWEGTKLYYNGHTEVSNKLPFDDDRFWYLIGRFIGDGWVVKRAKRNGNISGIKICCGKHELDELKDKIGDIFNYYLSEERTVYKLQFTNKELGEFCNQFGIGAANKQIPQNILDLKSEYLQSLLEGILDSDGCFDGTKYRLTSVSKKLAYNVGELVLKLYKIPYHIHKTKRPSKYKIEGREVNQKNTYTVYWQLENYNKKINYVDDDYFYSRIRKINTRVELSNVYNIEVENTHSYCINNIATHNCQDFSVAGKQAGGDLGTGTRSSLMWNTINIVTYCKPKYVIWENVKNLLSKKHRHNFDSYLSIMESLGYNNYYEVLNAKDYGIPQNRERVYTISIRKDIDKGDFVFPDKEELKLCLKNMLEEQVDEKYYLDNAKISKIKNSSFIQEKRRIQEKEYCDAILARDWKDPKCVQVGNLEGGKWDRINESCRRVYSEEGISPTIHTCQGGNTEPKIILKSNCKRLKSLVEKTQFEEGKVLNMDLYNQTTNEKVSQCLTEPHHNTQRLFDGYRIRKLTPKECWRLMGFSDEDFEKAAFTKTKAYIEGGTKICNAKLKVVKEKQRHIDTDTYVLCTTNNTTEQDYQEKIMKTLCISKEQVEKIQNVNIAIELLEEAELKECAISIIKCGDYMETLYTLIKNLEHYHTAIIELEKTDSTSTEKYMKITSEENLDLVKSYIISILIKQIIASKIYGVITQKANIQGLIAIITDYKKNLMIMKLLNLKMEFTTRLNSDTALYKQAGNSIVVNVLEKIFENLFKGE